MIDCSKTENYLAEKQRMTKNNDNGMCKLVCRECPLYSENNGTSEKLSCMRLEVHYPKKAIEIVQKWSDEHPQKTYLSEFLEHFPNAPLHVIGMLAGTPKDICPYHLGLMSIDDCRNDRNRDCIKCWNQAIEEE